MLRAQGGVAGRCFSRQNKDGVNLCKSVSKSWRLRRDLYFSDDKAGVVSAEAE